MNPRESFTLCPTHAFSEQEEGGKDNRVIPGTIRQDWKTGDDRRFDIVPEVGLGIRAAPFELSINDRNLPMSGTITPLTSFEHRSWMQARQGNPVAPTPLDTSANLLIRQPYLPALEENDEETWKFRYLQSEMASRESRMAVLQLLDERRRMQIRVLELEAQLFEARRQQGLTRDYRAISGIDVKETREVVDRDTGSDKGQAAEAPIHDGSNEREEPPEESTPTVQMTRSRLCKSKTENKDNDATIAVSRSTKTETDADKAAPDISSGAATKSKPPSKKATLTDTSETQEGTKTSPLRRSKRKRNMEGSKQTRPKRRTKAGTT